MTRTLSSRLASSTAARISPGITSSIALRRSGRFSVRYAFASRTSYVSVSYVDMAAPSASQEKLSARETATACLRADRSGPWSVHEVEAAPDLVGACRAAAVAAGDERRRDA